jgi:hypothetical protein
LLLKGTRMTEAVLACNANAFTPEQRARYGELKRGLLPRASSILDVPNGLEMTHDADTQTILELAEFATLERLCCPFLTFNLEIAPNDAGSKLTLTGPDGTSSFLRHELGIKQGDHHG